MLPVPRIGAGVLPAVTTTGLPSQSPTTERRIVRLNVIVVERYASLTRSTNACKLVDFVKNLLRVA